MACLAVCRRKDVIYGFARGYGAVMTDNAGQVYHTVIHAGRHPSPGRMAQLAVIRCGMMISRFTRCNSAVMAGYAGVAYQAVIDACRCPCPGRVAQCTIIRSSNMARRFTVDNLTVMAACTLRRDTAVIHYHRRPLASRISMAGTAVGRYRQMPFRLGGRYSAVMTLVADILDDICVNESEIIILRVDMTFVTG